VIEAKLESSHLSDRGEVVADNHIIVAGHSHMGALVGFNSSESPKLQPVADHANVLALVGPGGERTDAYWRALQDAAPGNCLALVWGGNEHNVHYFFEDQAFDFVSRHVRKLVSTLNVVPQGLVREKFNEVSVVDLRRVLADLLSASPKRIAVVGTPPPRKDNDELRKLLVNEPHFKIWAQYKGLNLASAKITAPHVRLKLWYLLQDMFAVAAQEAGAIFIPVPDQLRDEEGFLPQEYWYSDVTHANRRYGDIMLKRVIAQLSEA
jgi:hypothetical protein